jgi:hypothetical protein
MREAQISVESNPPLPPTALMMLGALGGIGIALFVAISVTSGKYHDFTLLYDSVVLLRAGLPPYAAGPNLNPPHVVVLMLPLAWLTILWASIVCWLLSIVAIVICYRLWRQAMPTQWAAAALCCVGLTSAGAVAFGLNNLTWPIAAGISWAWVHMRQGRTGRAGVMLGLMAATRVFLLLFIPYLVWRREWRAVIGAVAGILIAALVGLVAGADAYRGWIHELASTRSHWHELNASILAFTTRAFAPSDHFPALVAIPGLARPAWLALSAVVVFVTAREFRDRRHLDAEWAAVILTALLLSPLGWSYYASVAAGPLAATWSQRRGTFLARIGLWAAWTPWIVLTDRLPHAWLSLTLGSAYTWSALLLWRFCVTAAPIAAPEADSVRTRNLFARMQASGAHQVAIGNARDEQARRCAQVVEPLSNSRHPYL